MAAIEYKPNDNLAAGLEYLDYGLSVIPVERLNNDDSKWKKQPSIKWKEFQSKLIEPKRLKSLVLKAKYIGIVTGEVSGGLEVIDVDLKYDLTGTLWSRLSEAIKSALPEFYENMVTQKTINNGYHIFYKCDEIAGNQKLAMRATSTEEKKVNPNEKEKVLIETRGEGGYVVVAPSYGYEIQGDGFEYIPTITKEERSILLSICRSFSLIIKDDTKAKYDNVTSIGLSIFEQFNRNENISELLSSHGWSILSENYPIDVLRPGNPESGKSGSILTSTEADPIELLFVFSSSTEFPTEYPLNASRVYHILKGRALDQDWNLTIKEMQKKGYKQPKKEVTEQKGSKAIPFIESYISELGIKRNEINGQNEVDGIPHTDEEVSSLILDLKKANSKVRENDVIHVLKSDRIETFNPFTECLNKAKEKGFKGNEIDLIIDSLNIVDSSDTKRSLVRKWLIQLAAAMSGVMPAELFLILVGKQNSGKTRFFRELLPKQLSKRYVSIQPIRADKDFQSQLATRILMIDDEITGMLKKDPAYLKYLTSSTDFDYRAPYARLPRKWPRYAVFGGTTNEKEILRDETGNRRFIVIEVGQRDEEIYNSVCKLSLLAQLKNEWDKNGWDCFKLSQNERGLLDNLEDFEQESMEAHFISKYFEPIIDEYDKNYWTSTEVCEYLNERIIAPKLIKPRILGSKLTKIFGDRKPFKKNGKSRKGYAIKLREIPLSNEHNSMPGEASKEGLPF